MLVNKTNCNSLSDQEIIKKSLEDINYFACLYDRYEEKLLRYIHRILKTDPQEANDILQDAFIKIWKNLNDYDNTLKFSSWIYRIVHNETISHIRKKRSYGKNNISPFDENNRFVGEIEFNSTTTPEIDINKFHQILDQIPTKYKEVLILKFMENMNYQEISDILKIPEGTVATRINRAKKMFKNSTDLFNLFNE